MERRARNLKRLSLALAVDEPSTRPSSHAFRPDEAESPSAPYIDGPVQILPGIWLGAEDNARDWQALSSRGIRAILNVAKEVVSPFDSLLPNGTLYKATAQTPDMHYLKLPWSHGQPDLVQSGFVSAMAFVDAAMARNDGVLVHCQCGISRSATIVIALVMRAAVNDPSLPSNMHSAYAFVKEKSKCISPNMSLMYQLLEYERSLAADSPSDLNTATDDDEEWCRRRRDYSPEVDAESFEVAEEARALDKAMQDRFLARKSSAYSDASSTFAPLRLDALPRRRTPSLTSSLTASTVLTEEPEDPSERDLLVHDSEVPVDEVTSPQDDEVRYTPALPPPTPSVFSFPRIKKTKRRPPPLGLLPTVPSSPIATVEPEPESISIVTSRMPLITTPFVKPVTSNIISQPQPQPPPRTRRHRVKHSVSSISLVNTPSQTLFVFPPSPTGALGPPTASMMMVTSSGDSSSAAYPHPPQTPRVVTVPMPANRHLRNRSFIGLRIPATPTTACSRVDARGWIESTKQVR